MSDFDYTNKRFALAEVIRLTDAAARMAYSAIQAKNQKAADSSEQLARYWLTWAETAEVSAQCIPEPDPPPKPRELLVRILRDQLPVRFDPAASALAVKRDKRHFHGDPTLKERIRRALPGELPGSYWPGGAPAGWQRAVRVIRVGAESVLRVPILTRAQ